MDKDGKSGEVSERRGGSREGESESATKRKKRENETAKEEGEKERERERGGGGAVFRWVGVDEALMSCVDIQETPLS